MRIAIATAALALMTLVVGAGNKSDVIAASNPPLPEGNGLAARYPGDAGIANDSAVIFADDFESYANSSGLTSRWNNVFQTANVRIATEQGNVFGGGKALEFTIPVMNADFANSVQRSVSPELDTLFLRYYSKYDPAFNVVASSHNGGIISAHYCCPGVRSDGTNKFLVSYEASRFESATPNPGELNAYVYHPDMRDIYGDHFHPTGVITPYAAIPPFTFGPEFIQRPAVVPPLGRWNEYELMVKANTPGQRDGRIGMWLDGKLIADFVNLRFRDTTALKIDLFRLEFHINGNNPTSVKKWYDNVVAATSYIGPMVSSSSQVPQAPTGLRIVSGTE